MKSVMAALSILLTAPLAAWAQPGPDFPTRIDVPETRFMYSATVRVEGVGDNVRVAVSGGRNTQYSVDLGRFTNDPGRISDGQQLTLRHISGFGSLATTTSTVTLGAQTRQYTTITPELSTAGLPSLSIHAGPPVAEGLAGSVTRQRVELRLSAPAPGPVEVELIAEPDTANLGEDFALLESVATIAAGERRGFAAVAIANDLQPEATERYRLRLGSVRGAVVDPLAEVTEAVINDDARMSACAPLPAVGLCAGVAEGALEVPIGVPLGGYLRPPVGGEYVPGLEAFGEGDAGPFFEEFAGFIPEQSEGGGVNATPPNEARTSQYSTFSPSTRGYYDTLVTKALAMSQGGETLVFVKLDTVGMIDEISEFVLDRVEAETGIDLGHGLIMNATHTHDGPGAIGNRSVKYFWAALDAYHQDLFERVATSIADVVIAALRAQVPARFGYDTGQDTSGANSYRRSQGIYDEARRARQDELRRRIGVLRVDEVDADGAPVRPLAAMVNFAAHGIVFDIENLYFSGDALGGLERSVQARFDEPVLVMQVQAAGGDVSPRADGSPKRQRVERFGEQLAPLVMGIYDGIDNFTTAPTLKVLRQRFVLNRQVLGYAAGEYPYEFGAAQCNADFEGSGNCVAANPNGADDEADNGVAENDSFVPQDSLIAAVQVGDAVLLTQPGEPLGEYGLRLLDDSPFGYDNTFIWGYALDHVGYILPNLKIDWDRGGTEGTTTFWGWKQGGRMRAITNALMDALHTGSAPPADEFELAYTSLPRTDKTPSASPSPGRVITQPASLRRFEATTFRFEGGDPIIDLPVVRLEEQVDGRWQPMRRPDGRVLDQFYEFWVDYVLVSGAHGYTIEFEPAKDFPAGRYRFRADGVAAQAEGTGPYTVTSLPFDLRPANNLLLEGIARDGDTVSATLAYTPVPTNYRLIDPVGSTEVPPPVRQGRVRFALGGTTVEATEPVLTQADGRVLATYTATLPGSELPTAQGTDIWGNRSPDEEQP